MQHRQQKLPTAHIRLKSGPTLSEPPAEPGLCFSVEIHARCPGTDPVPAHYSQSTNYS